MDKYFIDKNPSNGKTISQLVNDIYNLYQPANILFVRTYTTGDWLDKLLLNNNNVTRILYKTDKTTITKRSHRSTIIIDSTDFENKLNTINKKFDLICMDPFHEYEYSKNNLFLLSSFLSDTGILISHDCFPKNKMMASPKYFYGDWCGETYVAFVEFAYKNPTLYYVILNTDTGIGIISKLQFDFLKNELNILKQQTLLSMHEHNSDGIYEYFCENAEEIINSINV